MSTVQFLPYRLLNDFCIHWFGHSISERAIVSMVQEAAESLLDLLLGMKTAVEKADRALDDSEARAFERGG